MNTKELLMDFSGGYITTTADNLTVKLNDIILSLPST